MALTEAISHLNKGLELVNTLPVSAERDASELALRLRLGTAWIALEGWAAAEVWSSFHPALALAKSLGRNDALVPIFGVYSNILTQAGWPSPSRGWRRCLTWRRRPRMLICWSQGTMACLRLLLAGQARRVFEARDKVLTLYDEEKHSHSTRLCNQIPRRGSVYCISWPPGCWATRTGRCRL